MKAYLITDVDDNADFENALAKITMNTDNWGASVQGFKHWYNDVKIKPIPEKISESNSYMSEIERKTWNDCIDEILGEEQ